MTVAKLEEAYDCLAKHFQDLADALSEAASNDFLPEMQDFSDFAKLEEIAKAAKKAAKSAPKNLESLYDLGAKLLPNVGEDDYSKFGLDPLQMLVNKAVRTMLFKEIEENRDPKTPLLELLDEGPAAQVGYAKYLKLLLNRSTLTKLKENNLEIVKVALGAILQPLSDPVELAKSLDQGH